MCAPPPRRSKKSNFLKSEKQKIQILTLLIIPLTSLKRQKNISVETKLIKTFCTRPFQVQEFNF